MSFAPGSLPTTPGHGRPSNPEAAYTSPSPSSPFGPERPPHGRPPAGYGPTQARELYRMEAKKRYPQIPPRNDFDALIIATSNLDPTLDVAAAYRWLDEQWELTVTVNAGGDVNVANAQLTRLLDQIVEPTGDKPQSPDEPGVDYVDIPDTPYSLRFWPGSRTAVEYCMDFVVTETEEAINVPPGFEVWVVSGPTAAAGHAQHIVSIERAHNIAPADIKAGEEKFILRDGLVCQLLLNGQKVMRFQVPKRPAVQRDEDPIAVLQPRRVR